MEARVPQNVTLTLIPGRRKKHKRVLYGLQSAELRTVDSGQGKHDPLHDHAHREISGKGQDKGRIFSTQLQRCKPCDMKVTMVTTTGSKHINVLLNLCRESLFCIIIHNIVVCVAKAVWGEKNSEVLTSRPKSNTVLVFCLLRIYR